MNKLKIKAFTLVELVIVIAILAILGTIAFISLNGYSTQARDSARISDMSSIVTALELFNLDAGKYPLPTEWTDITYSGSVVWKQGTFGETADTNTKIIDRIVLDPLTNSKYTYSVTTKRNEYEVGGILEGDSLVMNSGQGIMNNVYSSPLTMGELRRVSAGTVEATAFVKGNYNGLVTKSLSGTNCDLLSSPTIIASDIVTSTDVVEIIDNERLVYNGFNNLPSSFRTSKFNSNGGFAFRPNKIVAYSDTNSCQSLTDQSNYIPRMEVLEGIQQSYSGTNLNESGEIKNILSLNINTSNPSNEVLSYGGNFVNNYFGGKVGIGSSTGGNGATYAVSFNTNGGIGGTSSVIASYGSAMPVLSIPTRSGYTFLGYFDAISGGTKYYNADGTSATNYNINGTSTLYAHWIITPPPPIPNVHFGKTGSGTANVQGLVIKADSSGNIYVGGYVSGASNLFGTGFTNIYTGGYLVKFNGYGVMEWYKTTISPDVIGIDNNSDIIISDGGNLKKYDRYGNLIWSKNTGSAISSEANDIVFDENNNIYISGGFGYGVNFYGSTYTTTNYSNLLKFNSSGDLQWYKYRTQDALTNVGDSIGTGLDYKNGVLYYSAYGSTTGSVTGIRNVNYLGSTIQLNRNNSYELILAKLDTDGNTSWITVGGGTGGDRSFGLDVGPNDEIYVSGWFNNSTNLFGQTLSTTNTAGFILKLTNTGALAWAKQTTSTNGFVNSNGLQIDKDGNIIYGAIITSGTVNFYGYSATANSTNDVDAVLIKLDSSGNVIWGQRTSGGANTSGKTGLDTDADGNIYTTGTYFRYNTTTVSYSTYNVSIFSGNSAGTFRMVSPGSREAYFVKLNSSGTIN